MQFQKISAPSLKELFVTQLEGMILSGELTIGSKLPSERELANSMQVSRAVVNMGIAEMERKGFLVVKPRVGTFVEDYRKNGSLDTLVSIMRYNGGGLANDEVKSILELRIVLIMLASRLTIATSTDEEIAKLSPHIDAVQNSSTNEELVESIFQFYHELAFISGNCLLPLIFVSFKDLVCKLWFRYIVKYGQPSLIENTIHFYDLLLSKDEDAITNFIMDSSMDSINGSKTIYN